MVTGCLVAILSAFSAAAQPNQLLDVTIDIVSLEERFASLKRGGHLLVMRHAATDHSQKDLDRSLTPDCTRQRDLSAQGIRAAKAIGAALEKLNIPVSAVYSSPYCRTTNTAALAFGDYAVDEKLQFSISKSREESEDLARHLATMLKEKNPGDSNVAFVTHTSNIRDATGVWPKPEGTILVFEPDGSILRYKGMIKPADWDLSDTD